MSLKSYRTAPPDRGKRELADEEWCHFSASRRRWGRSVSRHEPAGHGFTRLVSAEAEKLCGQPERQRREGDDQAERSHQAGQIGRTRLEFLFRAEPSAGAEDSRAKPNEPERRNDRRNPS